MIDTIQDTIQNSTHMVVLSPIENEILQQVSYIEHLDKEALLKKFVRDGLGRYRLEYAIRAYQRGEVTLNQAAHHADVSVEDMLNEMESQGVYIHASFTQFLDGLENLQVTFGGSSELHQLIQKLRQNVEAK